MGLKLNLPPPQNPSDCSEMEWFMLTVKLHMPSGNVREFRMDVRTCSFAAVREQATNRIKSENPELAGRFYMTCRRQDSAGSVHIVLLANQEDLTECLHSLRNDGLLEIFVNEAANLTDASLIQILKKLKKFQDILSLSGTCRSLRFFMASIRCCSAWEHLQVDSSGLAGIRNLFLFLKTHENIRIHVKSLALPHFSPSTLWSAPYDVRLLFGKTWQEQMDTLCSMCPTLPNLRHFEIGELRTDVFGPRMPTLKSIAFSLTADDRQLEHARQSWKALEHLKIKKIFGRRSLKYLLREQKRLTTFELNDRFVRSALTSDFRSWLTDADVSARMANLTLACDCDELLDAVGQCLNLKTLTLDSPKVTDAGLKSLHKLKKLKCLHVLCSDGISHVGWDEFFGAATFSLRVITLKLKATTDARCYDQNKQIILAMIDRNPNLEDISISGDFTSEMALYINALSQLKTLRCNSRRLDRYFLDGLEPRCLKSLELIRCIGHADLNYYRTEFGRKFPGCRVDL